MNINEYIGKQITSRRKNLGIRQEDFANYLEMSRPQLCNIEKGKTGTTSGNIYKICCGLHCEVSDLFPPIKEAKHKTRKVERVIKIQKRVFINKTSI